MGGTVEPSSVCLRVCCGRRTTLHEALRLLLREVAPETRIVLIEEGASDEVRPAIRVELADSNRWMSVLQSAEDVVQARNALADGAWCLAVLDFDMSEFGSAVDALIAGKPYSLPVSLARRILAIPAHPAAMEIPEHRSPLTRREREVLRLVARGLSNGAIASELSISIHTVRTHLSAMAAKIEAHNRMQMVTRARSLGYTDDIDPPS